MEYKNAANNPCSPCGSGTFGFGLYISKSFSNPLATPDTVGVSSGTCFGAAVAIFSGLILLSLRQLLFVWNYCRVADLSCG